MKTKTYDLPTTINVGGKDYPIRYGWRSVVDVLAALNDSALDDQGKFAAMLQIIYPGWKTIPGDFLQEAIEKACEFIDCGEKQTKTNKRKTMDWEQDAPLIIAAVNNVAKTEVRANPNIHWWTFYGWYMSIGESLFSSVIHIRAKQAKGKKLEKHEEEFYRENKALIDFRKPENEEAKAEKENILRFL